MASIHGAPRMAGLASMALFVSLCAGCSSLVNEETEPGSAADTSGRGSGAAGGPDDPGIAQYGTSCRFLRGSATLESWQGDDSAYPASLYSFEFASNELEVVRNDGDVLYEGNMFGVNTVTDDVSFIVDLGDIPLADVPRSIDPNDYPTGNWGDHDWVQAVVHHGYAVRTVDGNTRQWAAFRVIALEPGEQVSFDWIRSPDPDALVYPDACF